MKIFYLILVLTVCKISATADADKKCDVTLKGAQELCTYWNVNLNQDNGILANKLCGCAAGFIRQNATYCDRTTYSFAELPVCGELVKSKKYDELIADQFTNIFIQVVLKAIGGVCSNSDQEIQKAFDTVFRNDFYSSLLENVITVVFGEDSAPFNKCYEQIREKITSKKTV